MACSRKRSRKNINLRKRSRKGGTRDPVASLASAARRARTIIGDQFYLPTPARLPPPPPQSVLLSPTAAPPTLIESSRQTEKFTNLKKYDEKFNQLVVNYNGNDFYNNFQEDCINYLKLIQIHEKYKDCVTIIIKVNNMEKKFDENRIKEISKYLYNKFFSTNDEKYKLAIDNNMPLPDERLSIGAESDHLVLYYNPKGTSMGTFAPTGHGGINGFLFLKDKENTEFIIGTIMNRGGKNIFNAFGGSPDYEDKSDINDKSRFHKLKEDYNITLHREMIEELFEKIFRYKSKISKYDNNYKIFNAIMSNLNLKDPYFKTILHYNHKKFEINKGQFLNSTIFKPVKIPNEYDGLYFYHPLPTTIKVDSITEYYVNDLVEIPNYTCDKIFGSVCDTYAKKELKGVFMIKRTQKYHKFVYKLINHINSGTIKDAKKEIEETEIDFINLKINDDKYKNNLRFEYEIIPTVDEKNNCNFKNNMLYIYLKNSDNARLCVFIKVALQCNYKLLVEEKKHKGIKGEPPINVNAGLELYFLLKYLAIAFDEQEKYSAGGHQAKTTYMNSNIEDSKRRRPTKRKRPTKRRRVATKKRR